MTSMRYCLMAVFAFTLTLGMHSHVSAHCDTLDGPVIQDARKALATRDVTPVLKWVREKDEKVVKGAFTKALDAQGKKRQEAEEKTFFESLVRIHRTSEGAPFTGLKPAGEVEPVIAQADKALLDGKPDELVSLVTASVAKGISQRYETVAEAFKHKEESVQKGREYVAAYVVYTHYVEQIQQKAEGHATHHTVSAHKKHEKQKQEHGH